MKIFPNGNNSPKNSEKEQNITEREESPKIPRIRNTLLEYMARRMCARQSGFPVESAHVDSKWQFFRDVAEEALAAIIDFDAGRR